MVNGQFQVGPCPVHDMVGSDLDWVGLTHNFLCNFRDGLGFFLVSGKIFWPIPDPTLDRVGSGFFRASWVGFIKSSGL